MIWVPWNPTPLLANWARKSNLSGSEFPLTQMPQFTKYEFESAVGSVWLAVSSVRVICPS
jgi:hypothetical protein